MNPLMNPLSPLGMLAGTAGGGFGGGIQRPVQPQQPQASGSFMDRLMMHPGMANALLRMGGGILQANATGAGFGGSLGAGVQGLADGMQQGQEMAMRQAQMDALLRKAQKEEQYGVQSGGFEGDIARAMTVINDPMASERDKRVAQSVIQTAESMAGGYDPVDQVWKFNQRRRLNAGLPAADRAASMDVAPAADPVGAPAPDMLPEPTFTSDGALTPPPATRAEMGPRSGGMPPAVPDADLREFGYIPTGNRKVDAENRGKAVQARMESLSGQNKEGRNRVTESHTLAQNATGILTKLDEAEQALKDFPTGFAGNLRGTGRQMAASLGIEGADQSARGYETISRLSKELGAEGLKQFGGSDTQMELKVAIETAIDPNARPDSNRRVLDQKRTAMQIIAEKPAFMEQYQTQNGTLEGFEKAWMEYQKQQWDGYKNRTQTPASAAPQDDPFGLRRR
jgi:hypothetical protein